MSDKELMIMFAFRYCMGRRTYAPSTFIDYVTGKLGLNTLSTECLNAMVKEIDEASAFEGRLGDDCDAKMWIDFKDTLVKTIEK